MRLVRRSRECLEKQRGHIENDRAVEYMGLERLDRAIDLEIRR